MYSCYIFNLFLTLISYSQQYYKTWFYNHFC